MENTAQRQDVRIISYVTEAERLRIAEAAQLDGRKVAAWIRQACREKLERSAG